MKGQGRDSGTKEGLFQAKAIESPRLETEGKVTREAKAAMRLFIGMFEKPGNSSGVAPWLSNCILAIMVLAMNGCLFERKSGLDHPSVCGYVYESGSEKTISGALVRVHFCFELNSLSGDRLATKTDSSGYFYLGSKNCMGKFQYEINISKDGYDTLDQITSQIVSGLLDDCLSHDYYLNKR